MFISRTPAIQSASYQNNNVNFTNFLNIGNGTRYTLNQLEFRQK
jgi:hypothetical protein